MKRSINIPDEMYERLVRTASEQGISTSAAIKIACSEYLAKFEKSDMELKKIALAKLIGSKPEDLKTVCEFCGHCAKGKPDRRCSFYRTSPYNPDFAGSK